MDASPSHVIILFLSILVGVAVFYQLIAVFEVWQFARSRHPRADADRSFPPVTLLKPLTVWNEEVRENVRTFCQQDYPRFQIILGPRSDAVPALQRLPPCPSNDHRLVTVVICDEQRAVNPKISQILQMWPQAKHDFVVMADADMRATPDYLRRVVAPLDDENVGVVTCFHTARDAKTLPALIEALLINTEYLPHVLVGRRLMGMRFAFGATIALRRDVLEAIGGFEALADYLADDYQIAHRAWLQGYRVILADVILESRLPAMTWRSLLTHQLRWARTNRACQSTGWFFSIITHLTLWSALWWLASGFSLAGWRVIILTLLFRMVQTAYYNALLEGLRPAWTGAWLTPVRDAVAFWVWAQSFLTNRVVWAGRTYEVFADGRMQEVRLESATAPQKPG